MGNLRLLDSRIAETLSKWGIDTLLPVQEQAVEKGLLEGKSLLVLAPTSSGKTWVGEIAAVHQALDKRKTAILVPFKALAEERYLELTKRWADLNLQVAVSTGDHPALERQTLEEGLVDVFIFTYERFLALMNQKSSGVRQFSTVVVDEIQMIADESRGGRLEWILTYLRRQSTPPQIVGLSAVVEDLGGLDSWLGTTVVRHDFRPIPLAELVITPDGQFRGIRHDSLAMTDEAGVIEWLGNGVCGLVKALVREDSEGGIMVFRSRVEDSTETAKQLRQALDTLKPSTAAIMRLKGLEQTDLNITLQWCLEKSIAFHNSELTAQEKAVVEEGLHSGDIRVVSTTMTLAMGVNLPCTRTVIVENKRTWLDPNLAPYSVAEYKNMAGRAGRYHTDAKSNGTAYMMAADEKEKQHLLKTYVQGAVEPIRSALAGRLDTLILSVLAQAADPMRSSELADIILDTFAGHSLWESSAEQHALRESVDNLLDEMLRYELVGKEEHRFELTACGRICAASGIDIPSFADVMRWVKDNAEFRPERFIAHACYLPAVADWQNLRFPNSKAVAQGCRAAVLREALKHRASDAPEVERVVNDLGKYDYQNVAPGRKLVSILMFLGGSGLNEIEGTTRVRPGTLADLLKRMEWLTDAGYSIAGALGKGGIEKGLSGLQLSLRYGVPAQGESLARLDCFERYAIMTFLANGLATPLAVLGAPDTEVARLVCSGNEEKAAKLKETIVARLGPTLPHYQSFVSRASSNNVDLIHRIYCSRGTQLEIPMQRLFDAYLPDLKMKHIKSQQTGEADFAFVARDGRIGIVGLGTKQDLTKAISLTKAGQILTQSPELHAEIYVSIGFPAFEPVARQKANAHGVDKNYKIITVTALLEAIFEALHEGVSMQSVYELLEDGRGDLCRE